MLNLNNTTFIKSSASNDFLPAVRPAVVFAGRSNVGKSSVINKLLNRKNLARVGATPGKTTFVNYFDVDGKLYFIDLPGYGYAKAGWDKRDAWARLIDAYFADAVEADVKPLGLLIIDSRHGPSDGDLTMAGYYDFYAIPYVVIANKCDKLGKTEAIKREAEIRAKFLHGQSVIMFSAEKGMGRDAVWQDIYRYLEVTGE